MEISGDLSDPSPKSSGGGGFSEGSRIAEVTTWLASQFESAGRQVPELEYTPRSVTHLHALASLSQAFAPTSAVAADLRLKASEYRSQAARIREILERDTSSPPARSSLATIANPLNIRDTEMSSFVVAWGNLSLRMMEEVEKRKLKVQKESKDRMRSVSFVPIWADQARAIVVIIADDFIFLD